MSRGSRSNTAFVIRGKGKMQEGERQEGKFKIRAPPYPYPGMVQRQAASCMWRRVEVQRLPK